MGTSERRAREREERRELFIDVAERLFFQQGYETTSVDQITRAAEFSKRTLYLYFADKREVFLAVVLRGLERMHGILAEAAGKAGPIGRNRLEALARIYFNFARQSPELFRAILSFEAQEYRWGQSREGLGKFALACIDVNDRNTLLVHETVVRGLEDGSIATDLTPAQFTLLLWGQLVGVLQVVHLREDSLEDLYSITPELLFEAFISTMIRGIGKA